MSRRRFVGTLAGSAALVGSSARSASAQSTPAQSTPAGARYVPVPPARHTDTRVGRVDRVDASTIRIPIPDGLVGAVAVSATITAVGRGSGYVSVYPAGTSRPIASISNVRAGETRANAGLFMVSPAGLDVYVSADIDLVVDITGWLLPTGAVAAGRFVIEAPRRVLDTRQSVPFRSGESRRIALGVPADATAVVCNLTVIDSQAGGHWTAWPGGPQPLVSNVNTDGSGQTRAAFAVVPVLSGGFELFTSAGGHIAVDVIGYVTGESAPVSLDGLFVPCRPGRMLDTRSSGAPLVRGAQRELAVDCRGSAALVNVTVIDAATAGYAEVAPAGTQRPTTSCVNAQMASSVPNAAVTRLGTRGVTLYSEAHAHYVVDIYGSFTGRETASLLPVAGITPFGLHNAVLEDRCPDWFDVGYSRQGRPLRVFQLGRGSRVALVASHVHGDEWTGESVLVDLVERGPIDGWTLLLVPSMNPDARARNERFIDIDMNRDFEVGWQPLARRTQSGCVITQNGSAPYALPESGAWRDSLKSGALARARVVLSHHDNYNWVAPQAGSPAVMRTLATDYATAVGLRVPNGGGGPAPTVANWSDVPGGFEKFCTAIGKPALLIENRSGYFGACNENVFGMQPNPDDVYRHYTALTTLLNDRRLPA
jgi:Zinc carboxypeptidase